MRKAQVALSYTNRSINLQSGNGVLVEMEDFTNGNYVFCFKTHLYDTLNVFLFIPVLEKGSISTVLP